MEFRDYLLDTAGLTPQHKKKDHVIDSMDHHVSGSLLFFGREDQVTKEYQVEDFRIRIKQPLPRKKSVTVNGTLSSYLLRRAVTFP